MPDGLCNLAKYICPRETADEYFAYLDTVYAEKKGYSNRLRKIIETRL